VLLEQIEAQLLRYPTFRLHFASGGRGLAITALCPWPLTVQVWRRDAGAPWVMSDGRLTFRQAPELREHSDVRDWLEQHLVRDVDGELERQVDEGPAGAFTSFADLLAAIILIQRLRARHT